MFMDFLKTLGIFGHKAPSERMKELVEIIEGQADLDSAFDVTHVSDFWNCDLNLSTSL
jgi:hypothetical protein